VELHIFVDSNSVEIHADNYKIAGATTVFPCDDCNGLEIYADNGTATADI
jgi:sucrose-6-phosphate hydrolase SacC (GH32 family)